MRRLSIRKRHTLIRITLRHLLQHCAALVQQLLVAVEAVVQFLLDKRMCHLDLETENFSIAQTCGDRDKEEKRRDEL